MSTLFCKGCDKVGNCGLNCGFCLKGQKHSCNKCNSHTHRSAHCNGRLGRCIFMCGFCPPGSDHSCRKCGAFNSHRTDNCQYTSVNSCEHCKVIQTELVSEPVQILVPTQNTLSIQVPTRVQVPILLVATPNAVIPTLMTQVVGAKPVMIGKHCIGFVYK